MTYFITDTYHYVVFTVQGQQALHEVKVQVLAKGVRGLVTLRRGLRSHDLSGSGYIHVNDFRSVLSSCHITLTDRVSRKYYNLLTIDIYVFIYYF
jgi:hypothetical protein